MESFDASANWDRCGFCFPALALPSESCAPGKRRAAAKPSGPAAHGVELTILDKTCKPCEDFYHYASGEWLAKNPVPAAYPSWGRFNELAERNRELLHQILESAAANTKAAPGSNEQKIGDFYASCMDEKQINAAGAKPLDAEFARIDGDSEHRGTAGGSRAAAGHGRPRAL